MKVRENRVSLAMWVAALLSLRAAAGWAEAADGGLFGDHSVLEATLTGPLNAQFEDPGSSRYLPFVLETAETRHEIEVRLRGHSRREVCDFPPLRLRFPAPGPEQGPFAGQEQLKLVTHCRNHDRGEQDMLEEYLSYRILNALTDDSLRVRLLRLTYRDPDDRLPDGASPRHAFLIEPRVAMAARTGARAEALEGVPVGHYDLEHAALVYVFQYLIGNTDWSLLRAEGHEFCCHNMELFDRAGRVFFVPYDFDLAGIVNAPYAHPDPSLRISRVRQRLYRGVCTDEEILRRAMQRVSARRAEILQLPHEVPGLEPRSQKSARAYLEAYFERAADEERLLRAFNRSCL